LPRSPSSDLGVATLITVMTLMQGANLDVEQKIAQQQAFELAAARALASIPAKDLAVLGSNGRRDFRRRPFFGYYPANRAANLDSIVLREI
jgi:hypothetical protein